MERFGVLSPVEGGEVVRPLGIKVHTKKGLNTFPNETRLTTVPFSVSALTLRAD